MNTFPRINIDLGIIRKNTQTLVSTCATYGVSPCGVAKLAGAHPEVVNTIIDGGITIIGDPRIKNLKKITNPKATRLLLRMPSLSQIEDVIKYADISLNTELSTLQALSVEACKQGVVHKVIIMHDLGDLREGSFYKEETFKLAEKAVQLEGLELIGLGSNLACYGGVEPSIENQTELVNIAKSIEEQNQIKLKIISGASSAGLPLMLKGKLPSEINQLRLGASLLMGIGLNDAPIPNTNQNAFSLSAEIVEIKVKPSVPSNSTALDAFGHTPSFIDRGIRSRAICAIGKQDIDFEQITLRDEKILLIGGSSDHLILDITDSLSSLKVGDIIEFELSYSGVLQCMTSDYIVKNFIRDF